MAILMVAGLMTSWSFAQKIREKDVQASVKSTFRKDHPSIKKVMSEKEGEIDLTQLPVGIIDDVKALYVEPKVKEGTKIDTKSTATYETKIKGMDLLFDSNDKFITEVKD